MYDLKSVVFSIVVYLLVTSAIGALAVPAVLKWRRSRPVGRYLSEPPLPQFLKILHLIFAFALALSMFILFPAWIVGSRLMKRYDHNVDGCYAHNLNWVLRERIEKERAKALSDAGLSEDEQSLALTWKENTYNEEFLSQSYDLSRIRVGAAIVQSYLGEINYTEIHKCPYERNPETCKHRFECESLCKRLREEKITSAPDEWGVRYEVEYELLSHPESRSYL